MDGDNRWNQAAFGVADGHSTLDAAARALRANDLAGAETLLRSRLSVAPRDAEALRLLAGIALTTGHATEAEQLLRNAIAYAPGLALAYADLASLLCRLRRADEALALTDRAIATHPGDIWPLSIKTGVLSAERRTGEALPIHEELVRRAPAATVLWMNYGHALQALGRTAEAAASFRKALQLAPTNGAAWWGLANLRTVRLEDGDIASMEQALHSVDDTFQRTQFHFALGKAFGDQGQFGSSFANYEKANRLRGAIAPYDDAAIENLVQAHISTITPSFVAERHGHGCNADDAIFIIGMPRSGSTLVEQILDSHPMVEGAGELFELQQLVAGIIDRSGSKTSIAEAAARLDAKELCDLGQRYLDSTRRYRRSARRFFIDKMPSNWQYVALIQLILPRAKIIDVRRHPLACCLSSFSTYFSLRTSFPTSLEEIGRYYRNYVNMMDHMDMVHPGRVYRLYYERLVENPEKEIRGLLAHLGLPFDPACLNFHENQRPIHTPSAAQVRKPIHADGQQRWRAYEAWLSPLKAELHHILKQC
ncbi:tetratricopeptide repeat-containing sulfotransferase family protein [Sphingomonas sp. KC8]|uniref:tetratricopeptide repeat-containing sulfotransferase family protein n=1 Tax=Sphingomonas sp. KC8 TaxID=1030157 RepID=UPI000248B1EC|nr:sulfotransferase [Sphingomonas sp. KC8]ARS26811.1 TPR repeat domain protein [Sphingomonas sp. KC8]